MQKPLPFFIALVLVALTLGCLMGCSTPIDGTRGSYQKIDGSARALAEYKRVEITPVVNQTQEVVATAILEDIFSVSKSSFINSGLFYEINGLTGPFYKETGPASKCIKVIPSLVSLNKDSGDTRILMHYAFIDEASDHEIVWIQVVGYGGEVGLNGAIQGVGLGLSQMLLEEITKKTNLLRHTRGS
jgi:hypothetical protein